MVDWGRNQSWGEEDRDRPYRNEIWVTKDGDRKPIRLMSDQHILFAHRMLRKDRALDQLSKAQGQWLAMMEEEVGFRKLTPLYCAEEDDAAKGRLSVVDRLAALRSKVRVNELNDVSRRDDFVSLFAEVVAGQSRVTWDTDPAWIITDARVFVDGRAQQRDIDYVVDGGSGQLILAFERSLSRGSVVKCDLLLAPSSAFTVAASKVLGRQAVNRIQQDLDRNLKADTLDSLRYAMQSRFGTKQLDRRDSIDPAQLPSSAVRLRQVTTVGFPDDASPGDVVVKSGRSFMWNGSNWLEMLSDLDTPTMQLPKAKREGRTKNAVQKQAAAEDQLTSIGKRKLRR